MRTDEIIEYVDALGGVLTFAPRPGDGSPEIAWGDVFFYYAPDGVVPKSQPFATIVTKDQPGDQASRLDRAGAFRLNISAGAAEYLRRTGRRPREEPAPGTDPSAADVVMPHPVYGGQAWLCVVDPGPRTATAVRDLLRAAHRAARDRHHRRVDSRPR